MNTAGSLEGLMNMSLRMKQEIVAKDPEHKMMPPGHSWDTAIATASSNPTPEPNPLEMGNPDLLRQSGGTGPSGGGEGEGRRGRAVRW